MRRAAGLIAVALALQGCTTPGRPAPTAAAVTPPGAWRGDLGPGVAIDRAWWEGFGDPVLAQLVATAVTDNTDIALAATRVEEARAQTTIARSALLPGADLSVGAQRSRGLNALGRTEEGSSAEPQLQFAYEVDLWGRLRDQAAAARAGLQASRAARDAVALSVAGATASGYINLRSLDARLAIARKAATARREALRIAESRARAGYTSQLELHQAESEYQATLQLVAQTELAATRQEDALRLLLGRPPGDVPRGAALADLRPLPAPEGLPSALLSRRPDIAQAEAQLVAADASYAAVRAQLLPQVRLTGAVGALFVEGLGDSVSIWSAGGSVLAPLFHGGRLRAEADAAGSRRDAAAFAYRRVVLTAFREVEDALAAVRRLSEVEARADQQRLAAAQTLRIAHNRYQAGYAPYLEELDAQRTLLNAELAQSQARGDRLSAEVALHQALGGGWSSAQAS